MAQRLEDTCVPRLISACHHRRLSGTLTFRQSSVVRHVYFEQGAIVYAASEVVTERFGERLCTLGCISPEQLAQAILETKKGKRLGACLVELGYLSATDLQAMLVGHITYLVHALFPWTTGEYQFHPQRVQVEGFQQALSPVGLIFEGIRTLPDLDLIRRWLGSPNRILQPVAAGQIGISGLELTPEEAFVLSRLDTPLRVEDVCRAVPLPEDKVLRALCALTITGIANFTDADPLPVIESSVKEPVATPTKTPASIDARQAAELCFELEEKLRVVDGGGSHYQVLGVNRRCTPEELKKAYRELAKKFHPDRHSQLAAFDFQVKAELERVFIAVQQAYEVLSDEEKRRKYDLTLNSSTWATPSGNHFFRGAYSSVYSTPPGKASSSGGAPKPPQAPPPRPPSPPSSASAPLKTPTNTAFPTPPVLHRPTAGMPPAGASEGPPATTSTTGARYPTGANQPVPPSPPKVTGPPPASLSGGMAPPGMPQRLTGAYPKAPDRAPAKPSPVSASELYLQTVEYLGNGDVERAYQAICQAVEQRPNNADYQALLARVLLRMPGRNKEAEKAFLTAIDLCRDPEDTAELLLELSGLYLKFGLESRAIECLDRGLALSPEHEELKKLRQSIGAKQKTTPRLTGSLRVATGRRLQALVGKVFGLDDIPEEGKSTG